MRRHPELLRHPRGRAVPGRHPADQRRRGRSQEVIKELGTNGGGYFNANSAHPFENPNGFTNLFEVFLILVIPFALTRTFGRLVGNVRQGYAILATMGVIWLGFTA